MAARPSIYKYDVMKLLLLGSLYFYIAYIYPAKSSDLNTSWERRDEYINLENCSTYNIKLKSCICWKNYFDRCIICCSNISCCFCEDCTLCWTRQRITRTRCIVLQEERDTQCSTIEALRERPPPYNEMTYNAPPLYTSPYNRASMQEAPPSYPGTPKLQERSQDTNDQFSTRHSTFVATSIAQHM
ncbi:hypothetical protein ACFW04_010345 [Cataglyphis niger]